MTIVVQGPCTGLGDPLSPSSSGAETRGANASSACEVAVLTQGMVKGDENAYRTFHDAYGHRLHRYLLVVARGDEDATREALQATLIRVARHIKVFTAETTFWNWLTVLARSALSDQRKKHRRYFAFLDRFTNHARAEAKVETNGEADAQLFALLGEGLDALLAEEKDLIDRKYLRDQSVRQIAEDLGLSEKAVESRLSRVRRKLKDVLLTKLKDGSQD